MNVNNSPPTGNNTAQYAQDQEGTAIAQPTASRRTIFGGLQSSREVSPSPDRVRLDHPRVSAALRAMDSRQARRLDIPLMDGAISVNVPVDPSQAGHVLLNRALAHQLPERITEQRVQDGSLGVSYTIHLPGEAQPWVIALHVRPDKVARRAQVWLAGSDPSLIADLSFDKSAFERMPQEISEMIAANLAAGDLRRLALTSSALTSGFAAAAAVGTVLEAVAGLVHHLDDLNRILINLGRDLRVCDLFARAEFDADHPVTGSRLVGAEKGRLLELLAQRVSSSDEIFDDGVMSLEEERVLARCSLLELNGRLDPHERGDLSALEDGRQFESLEAAVSAGVPLRVAIATFGHGDANDPDLQALAIPASMVLIRTGSTWREAAAEQGIAIDRPDAYKLQTEAVNTVMNSALRGLDSEDEVRRLFDAHDLNPADLAGVVSLWEDLRQDDDTRRVLDGDCPAEVAVPPFSSDLTELECARVLDRAPLLSANSSAPEDLIASLQVVHPISCFMAKRLYAGAAQSWIAVAKRAGSTFAP